jgi:phage terminase large subunit GpA-like protein
VSQFGAASFTQARVVLAEARKALKPPPRLSLSEWAEQKFYLSPESSADPAGGARFRISAK